MYNKEMLSLKSPLVTSVLFIFFIILLLFVWRSREHAMKKNALWKTGYTLEDTKNTPANVSSIGLEDISDADIERVMQALEKKEQECKDVDPLVSYYSKEYKNRWRQVIPNINSVGFTPIAKRCAYPGAPCEWQKDAETRDVNGDKYELLSEL